MGFLLDTDFKLVITDYILEQVIGRTLYPVGDDPEDSDDPFTAAKTVAIEECKSYLAQRYDADTIFAATGDNRNRLLVMKICDVALFHLHTRVTPNMVPTVRESRYDDAIDWFRGVASGKFNPDLPPKILTETSDQEHLFRMGSNNRFKAEY